MTDEKETYKIRFDLVPLTYYVISDKSSIYDPSKQYFKPYYLLSSIRGVLRTASSLGLKTLLDLDCGSECERSFDDFKKDYKAPNCILCDTYGYTGRSGDCRVIVEDTQKEDFIKVHKEETLVKLLFRGPYPIYISSSPLTVYVYCRSLCGALIVVLGLYFINLGIVRLGRYKSRAYGIMKVNIKETNVQVDNLRPQDLMNKKDLKDLEPLKNAIKKCIDRGG